MDFPDKRQQYKLAFCNVKQMKAIYFTETVLLIPKRKIMLVFPVCILEDK